jgi:hypothetical protein
MGGVGGREKGGTGGEAKVKICALEDEAGTDFSHLKKKGRGTKFARLKTNPHSRVVACGSTLRVFFALSPDVGDPCSATSGSLRRQALLACVDRWTCWQLRPATQDQVPTPTCPSHQTQEEGEHHWDREAPSTSTCTLTRQLRPCQKQASAGRACSARHTRSLGVGAPASSFWQDLR